MTMPDIAWKSEWLPPAQRFAAQTAVVDRDGAATYREVFGMAAGVAAALVESGVRPGDVVASVVPNTRLALATYAIALAGATEAAINPALSADDTGHCLALAGVKRVLTTAAYRDRFAGSGLDVLVADAIAPADLAELPAVPVARSAWGRIMFTSGTTSRPKGIVHSHGGRWIANLLMRATLPVAPEPGRAALLMTPFAHGSGLLTQAFLDGGAAVRLVDGVREEEILPAILGGEVDQIFAPPTVLGRLVALLEGRRIRTIRAIFCGTSPLLPDTYRKARDIFGPVVRITYGKTEMFNPITVLTPSETDRWYGSPGAGASTCVGWPASGVEVVVEAPGGGRAAPGEVGPVLLRSPHMLVATITGSGVELHPADAFHRSGDLGFLDAEGRLHLVGREADVIKTGGYRVTPEEVESTLRPALDRGELVVVGLPSAYWGEVITAVVAGPAPDWRKRLEPAVAAMTGYKRPRLFVEVPEIARNSMGKIVRRRIVEAILETHVFTDGRYPTLEPCDHATSERTHAGS